MQKRRHLETSFQQTDPCCTSDAQPHAFLLSGPASPGNKQLSERNAFKYEKRQSFSHSRSYFSP